MKLPLKNKRIVVTRDTKQSYHLIRNIQKLGGTVIHFPVICIREIDDWHDCDQEISHLESYDWLIFTSMNGARHFLNRLNKRGKNITGRRIAVLSRKIALFFKKQGIPVALVPEDFQLSGLMKALDSLPLNAERILLPVSNLSDDLLMNFLKIRGCEVKKIQVYRTVANTRLNRNELYPLLQKGMIHCLTFFSPSAFKFFVEIVGHDIISVLAGQKIPIAVIGGTTARVITEHGLHVTIKPEQSSEEYLVEAIVRYFSINNHRDARDG
jgi:uroporphyrinogen III methyltransferase/synthase